MMPYTLGQIDYAEECMAGSSLGCIKMIYGPICPFQSQDQLYHKQKTRAQRNKHNHQKILIDIIGSSSSHMHCVFPHVFPHGFASYPVFLHLQRGCFHGDLSN